MSLFLERLKELGISILAAVICVAAIVAVIALVELTRYIWQPLPTIILGLLLLLVVLFYLYLFIDWLIIEPIKQNKQQK